MFLDESGVHRGLNKNYGRAKSGKRVNDSFDDNPKDRLTLISAISLEGVFAEAEFKGGMDKTKFKNYSTDYLIPLLRPGMTVVMDNLSSHKGIEHIFQQHNINVLYLPPYTPEYNPIEMMWEKIKNYLRKNRAKDILQLRNNITKAYNLITSKDIQAWFIHCGYEYT